MLFSYPKDSLNLRQWFLLLLLMLLLLAMMTYNQIQLFHYVHHYVDIEITGYRAPYSKIIANRGIARLVCWLGTAGSVDCFNRVLTVILEYIDLF